MPYISRISALVAIACASVVPSAGQAQQADVGSAGLRHETVVTASPAPVANAVLPATPIGPRAAPAGIDVRASTDAAPLGSPQDGQAHLGAGSNLALMGAGAAAVIVGLIIGGDGGTIVAISGGVLGLVGLFRYIR